MKHKQSISKAVKWPTPSGCMVYYTCWILMQDTCCISLQ